LDSCLAVRSTQTDLIGGELLRVYVTAWDWLQPKKIVFMLLVYANRGLIVYTIRVMRVLEPHQLRHLKSNKAAKRNPVKLSLIFLGLTLVSGFGLFRVAENMTSQASTADEQQTIITLDNEEPVEEPVLRLREFDGEQFKDLYRSIAYPNSQQLLNTNPPEITGNPEADDRIRELAESRGYVLSSIPVGAIVQLDEPNLDGENLLQPLAASSWTSFKQAALDDNIPLILTSAYRPIEYQRELFLDRLYANGTNPRFIAAGVGDRAILDTLAYTAPPGYSRHHTGYTIDLWCDDGSRSFIASICYRWISNNNYENAKLHEWVPSYPEGASMQGPEPEAWEYVWVGKSILYQAE
jgi:LAS superfamily LD-carboxypeptidase LdcB